jgi:hypothetical protein
MATTPLRQGIKPSPNGMILDRMGPLTGTFLAKYGTKFGA